MPIKIKKNSAAAAAAQEAVMMMDHATLIFQDNQRWGNEAAAAAAADISTTSSTSETSISTAVAAACNATLARNMRREATAKRKWQVSEENDDDIVPKKDARILAMANKNMNFLSKQRDETSSASDEGEGEYDTQKGHPNAQYGLNSSMPNHVICPRFVDHGHTYRDFSTHIEEGGMIEKHIESEPERNFPACLHAMVSNEHYSHIISWMPHGRAWKVHNKRLLVGDPILGKILGLPSYSSFTRELSEWGFKMLHQAGPDYGCYYHECFLRGHPQLTALMKKTAEPDFYAIAKQHPLEKSADVERVLFLADVALQYSFDSSDRGQNEVPAKTASKYPSRLSRKKRSARKKSPKVSPKEKVPDLEDLPPQSEDNPAVIITRLNALMKRTHMTQKQLEKHDKQNGLPRSHAQTMLRSSRSRSQLQKALKKNKRELRKMPKKQDDE